MKERIVFFIAGAIVVILTISIYHYNMGIIKSITTSEADSENVAFDTVLVRGKLVVGSGENSITLENVENDTTNIILESKGSVIFITTNIKGSSITMGKQIGEFTNPGVLLTQQQRPQGNLVTHLWLKDSKGENLIRSTD